MEEGAAQMDLDTGFVTLRKSFGVWSKVGSKAANGLFPENEGSISEAEPSRATHQTISTRMQRMQLIERNEIRLKSS
ncbi:unnamed protein product [Anisakis simplex]|uniref:Uncharacterized protein n=1 Tax=Anisakis simplex TaxID=6269 RepID=A0A0M3KDG8_ANISI|nr:unnamed protein product [Anisakis simplex]